MSWGREALGNLCSVITDGAHQSPKTVENSGYPMASVKDMTPYALNLSTCRHISKEDFEKLVKQGCAPLVDDVLLAKDGNSCLDTVLLQREEQSVVLLSSVAILRPDKTKIEPKYLAVYLSDTGIKLQMKENLVSGSAIPRVVLKDLRNHKITVPPLGIQKKIADIIGSLDDKIELNLSMNETLERMAMALYKHWFVSFGPFQDDEFEESELGVIPKGWEIKKLSEVLKLSKKGITPKYSEELNDTILVLNQKCIRDQRLSLVPARRHLLSKKVPADKYLQQYDILVNSTGLGTLGRVAQVFDMPEPMTVDSHVRICRPNSEVCSPLYVGQFLKSIESSLQTMTEGSTGQAELSPDMLNIRLVFPPLEIQKRYEELALDWMNMTLRNVSENEKLSRTRNYLLPRLISGEIELGAAEKQIEGVI